MSDESGGRRTSGPGGGRDERSEGGAPDGQDEGRREVTLMLSVPAMDCPSCAGKVEKALDRLGDLEAVDLRPTAGTVGVRYDPARRDGSDVIVAVEGAGYEVVDRALTGDGVAKDGTATHETIGGRSSSGPVELAPAATVWRTRRAIGTWIGAALLVAGLLLEFVVTDRNVTVLAFDLERVVPFTELPAVVPDAIAFSAAAVAFLAATLVSGLPVVRNGYYSARNRSLDIDLLMGTAIVAASAVGLFIEAATLAVLFSIAELLERFAMDRTRDSLRELMDLTPAEARVIRRAGGTTPGGVATGGSTTDRSTTDRSTTDRSTPNDTGSGRGETRPTDRDGTWHPVEAVRVGDVVAVKPGERIPVDGVVTAGTSAVDQSPITGESVPVDKATGDEVYAGTLNGSGYVEIEVTRAAAESTLARVIDLVREAQADRTERERFVDRFAGYYTPLVVVLAILTAAVPPLLVDGTHALTVAGFTHVVTGDPVVWFVRGLTLLVISCPCAFVISTPVTVASGLTAAARNGVLITGGSHLETVGEVDAVAFDKTGTLTTGDLAVTDVVPFGDATEAEVLRYAGALERRSEHPIAEAILRRADADAVALPDVSAFESLTGRGVRATVDGTTAYAGRPELFAERGFEGLDAVVGDHAEPDGGAFRPDVARGGGPAPNESIASLQRAGRTAVVVGTADRLVGVVGIADTVHPEARGAIEALRRLGVGPIVMLTGDNEGTARAVSEELGIDEHRAGLLPDEKVAAIDRLRAEHGTVAMVGDGINDAPALATADVGIAMGAAGSDAAIETADVALLGDDLGAVPYLRVLGRRSNGIIRQNVWSSLGMKLLLAVGVPFGYVSVALAVVVGDMGMSLGVTGNAMRLARLEPEETADPGAYI